MDSVQAFLHHRLVAGTISGVIGAAAVDIAAFRKWKSFDDCVTYSWKTAFFRWGQGAFFGLVSTLGLNAVD
jgi:hypothetical protein